MTAKTKASTVDLERTIPATPSEVYDAWLDPKNPGSPWHGADLLVFHPEPNALFYIRTVGKGHGPVPHFGRFTALERQRRIQHTWMSPYTQGAETTVTITLAAKGEDTSFTLHHEGFPDDEAVQAHEQGWTYYLDRFLEKAKQRS